MLKIPGKPSHEKYPVKHILVRFISVRNRHFYITSVLFAELLYIKIYLDNNNLTLNNYCKISIL